MSYPLPVREEIESVGNPGFRQYDYRVTWLGDTVVRLAPVGEAVKHKTGFSEYAHKQVEIFYGTEGPGPLYQREYLLHETAEPKLTPLHMDDGCLDFWSLEGERGEGRGESEQGSGEWAKAWSAVRSTEYGVRAAVPTTALRTSYSVLSPRPAQSFRPLALSLSLSVKPWPTRCRAGSISSM